MQKISISGPAELVTIVPFHLGFQPERSVVVICLEGRAVGLVARLDVVGPSEAAQAAVQVSHAVRRDGATSVVLVSYEEEPGEARPLAAAVGAALGLIGIEVMEDLIVLDGRWYCAREDDCPDGGVELPAPADVPGVAGYVAAGRSVLGGRAAMEALVTPLPDEDDPSLVGAVADWRREYQAARETCFLRLLEEVDDHPQDAAPGQGDSEDFGRWDELVDECLSGWGRLVRGELPSALLPQLVPAIAGPLDDRDLRDALIGWLCPGLLPSEAIGERLLGRLDALVGPMVGRHAEDGEDDVATLSSDERQLVSPLLQDALDALCRATPSQFAAPVLSVTASHAWWRGDGTRAGMCVDKALEIDPDHALSRLIRLGLQHGLRPEAA